MQLKHEAGYSANPRLECISEIKAWMSMNFLHFNDDKTEVTLSGPTDSSTVPVDLGLLSQHLTPVATNLGVRLDSNLKFDAQVSSVVKSSFYQLRRLTKAKPFLSLHHFEI